MGLAYSRQILLKVSGWAAECISGAVGYPENMYMARATLCRMQCTISGFGLPDASKNALDA